MSVDKPDDGIGRGVAIAFGVQILTVLSAALANLSSVFIYCLFAFGLVQWLGLVPMMVRDFRKGYRLSVKGMAIMGAIGLLLNSACAGAFGNLPWQHPHFW